CSSDLFQPDTVCPAVVRGVRNMMVCEERHSLLRRGHRGGQGEKPALLYILFVLCSSAQCVCHCPHTRLRLNASRTEVVFITTQIVDDFPVGQNFDHAGCQTRDKLAVMRNKEQSAF